MRLILWSCLLITGPAAWSRGFEHRTVFNQMNVLSERRNNVFFVGERIVFDLEPQQAAYPSAATHYTVRDYFGNLVESGPVIGTYLALAATQPGW